MKPNEAACALCRGRVFVLAGTGQEQTSALDLDRSVDVPVFVSCLAARTGMIVLTRLHDLRMA